MATARIVGSSVEDGYLVVHAAIDGDGRHPNAGAVAREYRIVLPLDLIEGRPAAEVRQMVAAAIKSERDRVRSTPPETPSLPATLTVPD